MLLKGIKVLDLSTLLPGPMCSLFLADLGADVLKIESLNGDPMRYFEAKGNKNPYFLALNRNKKSMALNLKTDEGIKIFMKLAKAADVIIEGFRPGKVDALGIGYNSIKKINPKIIYCSITGYGQNIDNKNKAGHDLNYASLSGLIDIMSNNPFVPGVQIADVASSLISAFAIISAMFYRERYGKGTYIDVSMLDAALSFIGMHIAYHSVFGSQKTMLSGNKPCYNVYETKDKKFVSLAAVEGKFWQSFCSAIKREDLIKRQLDGSTQVIRDMQNLFKSKTSKEWVELNNKHDFCCEPIKKIQDVFKDRQFSDRGIILELDGVKQVAMPFIFSSSKKLKYSKSPKLGEYTDNILSNLGYDKKYISALRMKGVIN